MIEFDEIQGNIFGGFNKDFQKFVFLKVLDADKAKAWVSGNAGLISTSKQVLAFNNAFKALLRQGVKKPEGIIQARWLNIAFSAAGLKALGLDETVTGTLPPAFSAGMAKRAGVIGDEHKSAPKHWLPPFTKTNLPDVHVVLLIAADTEADLTTHATLVMGTSTFTDAFAVIDKPVEGRTRVDEIGHEHFGFKDGVSQPGVRGLDSADDALANPDQGHPGQDLLWPGEFVLGYPKQVPFARTPPFDGPNPNPGDPPENELQPWLRNGSFLVFRRLAQDVSAFHKQVAELAKERQLSVDLAGAKLVGRYRSGCPLEKLSMALDAPTSPTDPGLSNAALADSDSLNNAFEYGDDAFGDTVPLAAHIRKVYPRDEVTLVDRPEDSESDTQTHRLIRRGIPFGRSFGAEEGGAPADARGLLFLAYQSNLENQFEFVQSQWINKPTFPPIAKPFDAAHAGLDPIMSQTPEGEFLLKTGTLPTQLAHFVTTTGGEYFFAPSLSTLKSL